MPERIRVKCAVAMCHILSVLAFVAVSVSYWTLKNAIYIIKFALPASLSSPNR